MAPKLIKTNEDFQNAIGEDKLQVVHFEAAWADQCKQANEVLDALAKQHDEAKVEFYSCPAEELSELSLKYKIEAVPTILLFKSGKELDRVNGADAIKITEKVTQYIESGGQNLEQRLKGLINRAKVMLFMKGDRNAPRCGFSRQIIEILNKTGVNYETFDILTDEEVRQGLKTFSDWPTYPQLYVKGELLGGLDIVKEMLTAGDLEAALRA